jgi:hypothetical protein
MYKIVFYIKSDDICIYCCALSYCIDYDYLF